MRILEYSPVFHLLKVIFYNIFDHGCPFKLFTLKAKQHESYTTGKIGDTE